MTFIIGAACVDEMDRSCMEECPVDCIYEGGRKLYIHPDECIDCGACEPVCPVDAITSDRPRTELNDLFTQDARDFFALVLAGRSAPLGSPGGAAKIGPIGVDAPRIAGL